MWNRIIGEGRMGKIPAWKLNCIKVRGRRRRRRESVDHAVWEYANMPFPSFCDVPTTTHNTSPIDRGQNMPIHFFFMLLSYVQTKRRRLIGLFINIWPDSHTHTHTHSGALLSVLYIISIAQRFQYGLHLSSRWWWWDQTEKVMLSKKKKRHSSFWELYYSFKVITKYNWRWSTNWDVNKTKNKPEREQHQSLCVQLRHVG